MSKILISYRREDSEDVTGRIYDRLIRKFNRASVFKDVDSIPFGVDFRTYLDEQVARCQVCLAVIGPNWMQTIGRKGKSRLQDPSDFVRIEIESALKRGIPVIPVLVRGAKIPAPDRLPESLQDLAYRNGIDIRPDPDFNRDMNRLIDYLKKQIQLSHEPRKEQDAAIQTAGKDVDKSHSVIPQVEPPSNKAAVPFDEGSAPVPSPRSLEDPKPDSLRSNVVESEKSIGPSPQILQADTQLPTERTSWVRDANASLTTEQDHTVSSLNEQFIDGSTELVTVTVKECNSEKATADADQKSVVSGFGTTQSSDDEAGQTNSVNQVPLVMPSTKYKIPWHQIQYGSVVLLFVLVIAMGVYQWWPIPTPTPTYVNRAPLAANAGGTIAGKVTYAGNPEQMEFHFSKFPNPKFCSKHPNKSLMDGDKRFLKTIEVSKDGGLKGSVVAITDIEDRAFLDSYKGTYITASFCEFLPFTAVVVNGKNLGVENTDSDPDDPKSTIGVLHNPHSFVVKGSRSATDFVDIDLSKKGDKLEKPVTFPGGAEKAGYYRLRCDQHEFMQSFFLPVWNPYYAVVKDDGTFELKDVPPGKHKLIVWHPFAGKAKSLEMEVNVTDGGTAFVKAEIK